MRNPKHNVTLGYDPEWFFSDEDGNIIPADDVLPKRDNPDHYQGEKREETVQIFADGVQAEFNTTRTVTCRHHTSREQGEAMDRVMSIANSENLDVEITPAVELSEQDLEFMSDYASEFGCDPSYGAWVEGKELEAPRGKHHPVRYAGGHFHFGKVDRKGSWHYLFDSEEKIIEMVKMMDYLVSLPMTMLFGGPKARLRRRGYGKAGSYRTTPYGFEYRTPGNGWLYRSAFSHFALGQARDAISIVDNDETENILSMVEPAKVIDAINEADPIKAGKLWKEIQPYVQSRPVARHSSGEYYRCLDIISAIGVDEFYDPTAEHDYWGSLCEEVSKQNPDLLEAHEHGRVYFDKSDFDTQVAVAA